MGKNTGIYKARLKGERISRTKHKQANQKKDKAKRKLATRSIQAFQRRGNTNAKQSYAKMLKKSRTFKLRYNEIPFHTHETGKISKNFTHC